MRNNYADCDAEGKLNIVNNLTPSAVKVLAAADPDNAWVLDWIEISVSSTDYSDFQIFYLDASGVEHSVYKVKVYAGASGVAGANLFRDFSGTNLPPRIPEKRRPQNQNDKRQQRDCYCKIQVVYYLFLDTEVDDVRPFLPVRTFNVFRTVAFC